MSVSVMLARRPTSGQDAFGHIDVDQLGREKIREMIVSKLEMVRLKTEVEYDPDDSTADGEVLVAGIEEVDSWFQEDAPWSLERATAEIRGTTLPAILDESEIRSGGWTFCVVRADIDDEDILAVRGRSPTWGLKSKVMTRFLGEELKFVSEPLISFDDSFEVLAIDSKAYFLKPRQAERLFVDSDAIKGRAPQSIESFSSGIAAELSDEASLALLRVCQGNSHIARRVERLNRGTDLSTITVSRLREGLGDAGLPPETFGTGPGLEVNSDTAAAVLIDIAADLYYQPRFAERSRRVAAFRNVS